MQKYFFDRFSEQEMTDQMFKLLNEGKREEADKLAYFIVLNRLYKSSQKV